MATAILTIPTLYVARLSAAPSLGFALIERTNHGTPPREQTPAIQVRARRLSRGEGGRANCVNRVLTIYVDIIVRADAAADTLDPYLEAVATRLNPATTGFQQYGRGVSPELVSVDIDEDQADATAIRARIEYANRFSTPEDSLTIL